MVANANFVNAVHSACQKGGEFVLSRINQRRSVDLELFTLCKVPLALYAAGFEREARTELSSILREVLRDGNINPRYLHDRITTRNFVSYHLAMLALAALRLKDEESTRAFGESVLQFQDPTYGGFYSIYEPPERRVMHAVMTSICGTVCIRLGEKERAIRGGESLVHLFELQPDQNRFYYRFDIKGSLILDYAIDRRKTKQRYAVLGKIIWFLVNLYLETDNFRYLETAERIFRFADSCREDRHDRLSSTMMAPAAAVLHNVTGDSRHRSAAVDVAESIVKRQESDGSWSIGWLFDELERPLSITDAIKGVFHKDSFNLDRTSESVISLFEFIEASSTWNL